MSCETSPRFAVAVQKKAKALELRRAGYGFREIAAELDVSVGRAHQYVTEAFEDARTQVAAHTDELRAQELSRLDGLMQRLYPLATASTPDLLAVDRVIKCMERRARLLGLDAPMRVGLGAGVAAGIGEEGAVVTAEAKVTVYMPSNGR